MAIVWTIVFIVIVGLLIAIGQSIYTKPLKAGMAEKISKIKDFNATQKVMGEDGQTGLAIDQQGRKVCFN